jgi:hypothetical protein
VLQEMLELEILDLVEMLDLEILELVEVVEAEEMVVAAALVVV